MTGKRLAILGFAFKADTNDTREAPAIRIAAIFWRKVLSWPFMIPRWSHHQISRDLKLEPITGFGNRANGSGLEWSTGSWWSAGSVEQAVAGADAVLILTEWAQYKALNWRDLAQRMRRPAWVFDARSVVNPEEIRSAGLTLWRVGNGAS